MKKQHLYWIWLGLYSLCAGLGFLGERNAFVHILLGLLAIAFYIPAVLLLYQAITGQDKKLLLQVRLISLSCLLLTLLMIVLTIVFVQAGASVGMVLHILLNLVSAPMACFYWPGLGLFLWACLFIASFPRLWRK